jgi:hypothetical protein
MTTDLENRLTHALHGRAAGAMEATDTSAELQELEERLTHERASARPRRALVGAAAALTAAAVVLGVAWFAGPGDDPDRGPVDGGRTQTPAERVAQELAEAFADGDNARVASMLAETSSAPPGWRSFAKIDDAWSAEYFLDRCRTEIVTDYATRVGCTFAYHSLHSEELGLGPFGNNYLGVAVKDGEVRSFSVVFNGESNGEAALYESVGKWIHENHPEDWKFLETDGLLTERGAFPKSDLPRWVWLWQRYSAQYAAEMTRDATSG